jgi:hypothetical protein
VEMHTNATPMQRWNRSELARRLNRWLVAFGFSPRAAARALSATPEYLREAHEFRKALGSAHSGEFRLTPFLSDRYQQGGVADGHYFWQDLLVARRIFELRPERHVDVGSRVDGFISHLLVFRDVEVVDVRGIDSEVPGLVFRRGDGTSLSTFADASLASVSCLHAVEHFGLGRYGDPLDTYGHIRGLESVQRVLAVGGRTWISVPVGDESVEFNGQRILDPTAVPTVMRELVLAAFTAIPPHGPPRTDLRPEDLRGTHGWCGLYELVRP